MTNFVKNMLVSLELLPGNCLVKELTTTLPKGRLQKKKNLEFSILGLKKKKFNSASCTTISEMENSNVFLSLP